MVKRGERLNRRTLTTNEKILVQLMESPRLKLTGDVPFDLTQQGIADGVGIRVNHVSRAVKTLKREGLIAEEVARVRGEVRKRKVYALTAKGLETAKKLVEDLMRKKVLFKDDEGQLTEISFSEARERAGPRFSTVALLNLIDESGVLSLEKAGRDEPHARFVRNMPVSEEFYDREKEMSKLARWLERDERRVLLLTGPRGMGKTSLVAKWILSLPESMSLFWHTLDEWDTGESLLNSLALYLDQFGLSDLRISLNRSRAPTRAQALSILNRDLSRCKGLFVLDDYSSGKSSLDPIISLIMDSTRRNAELRVVLTSDDGDIPKREEMMASDELAVLEVGGLDSKSCRKLLKRKVTNEEFKKMYRLTEGHPLSFKLLASRSMDELLDLKEYTPEEAAILKYLKLFEKS